MSLVWFLRNWLLWVVVFVCLFDFERESLTGIWDLLIALSSLPASSTTSRLWSPELGLQTCATMPSSLQGYWRLTSGLNMWAADTGITDKECGTTWDHKVSWLKHKDVRGISESGFFFIVLLFRFGGEEEKVQIPTKYQICFMHSFISLIPKTSQLVDPGPSYFIFCGVKSADLSYDNLTNKLELF